MDEILTSEQWLDLKGRILQQYPQLTDAHLQYHEAVEKDLLTMVEFGLLTKNEMIQRNIDICV